MTTRHLSISLTVAGVAREIPVRVRGRIEESEPDVNARRRIEPVSIEWDLGNGFEFIPTKLLTERQADELLAEALEDFDLDATRADYSYGQAKETARGRAA
jgi:hypothetical protein